MRVLPSFRPIGAPVVAVLLLVVGLTACGGDDDATTTFASTPPTTAPAPTSAPATGPASTSTAPTTTAEPEAGWTPLTLDGCVCSDGSEPTFFERGGDPTRVVLYFEGGGACFSKETCDPNGDPTYSVVSDADAEELESRGGYFDVANEKNPLADHSWLYVPYCTGDVHFGSATTDYGGGVVIEHRGYSNAVTAFQHLLAKYPDIEQLVLTGASAGSIPTPLFAGLGADALPDADIVTFGDSSAAYPDVPAVNETIGTLWGSTHAIPDWPETAGITAQQWSIPGLYAYAGRHAPRVRLARFDYAFDEVQAGFAALAGVGADEVVTLIDQTEQQIEAQGVRVATYVAPGSEHTIVADDALYTMEVEGVRLIDWLTELIDGTTPADVHCATCT